MSIVDKREDLLNYMEKINWIESNIFSKFDKLGCMYVENVDVHRPDYNNTDRLYRRNDVSYGISFDSTVVYIYDKNFNLIVDEFYAIDFNYECPCCFEKDENVEFYNLYVETTIDKLIDNLDNWLEEAKIDYPSS